MFIYTSTRDPPAFYPSLGDAPAGSIIACISFQTSKGVAPFESCRSWSGLFVWRPMWDLRHQLQRTVPFVGLTLGTILIQNVGRCLYIFFIYHLIYLLFLVVCAVSELGLCLQPFKFGTDKKQAKEDRVILFDIMVPGTLHPLLPSFSFQFFFSLPVV